MWVWSRWFFRLNLAASHYNSRKKSKGSKAVSCKCLLWPNYKLHEIFFFLDTRTFHYTESNLCSTAMYNSLYNAKSKVTGKLSFIHEYWIMIWNAFFHNTGENIRTFIDHHNPASSTNYVFSNLSLVVGQRYFCSVRAYNKAGLYTTQSSDGFVVDTIPPTAGIVYDGQGLLSGISDRSIYWVSSMFEVHS